VPEGTCTKITGGQVAAVKPAKAKAASDKMREHYPITLHIEKLTSLNNCIF